MSVLKPRMVSGAAVDAGNAVVNPHRDPGTGRPPLPLRYCTGRVPRDPVVARVRFRTGDRRSIYRFVTDKLLRVELRGRVRGSVVFQSAANSRSAGPGDAIGLRRRFTRGRDREGSGKGLWMLAAGRRTRPELFNCLRKQQR
jgi:hypothetical protein